MCRIISLFGDNSTMVTALHKFYSILDLDPEKSLKSQLSPPRTEGEEDNGPPLKEDPTYIKVRNIIDASPASTILYTPLIPPTNSFFIFTPDCAVFQNDENGTSKRSCEACHDTWSTWSLWVFFWTKSLIPIIFSISSSFITMYKYAQSLTSNIGPGSREITQEPTQKGRWRSWPPTEGWPKIHQGMWRWPIWYPLHLFYQKLTQLLVLLIFPSIAVL